MRQAFLERSPRWKRVQSRALPAPLVQRDDFQRLSQERRHYLETSLRRVEELVSAQIEAWFLCSKAERENWRLGVFLSTLEADIEIAREHIPPAGANGENFSWWIFRDDWYPEDLRHKPFDRLLPKQLKMRLSKDVPRVGDGLTDYLAWLKRQNVYLGESLDEFYAAKNYRTVYVHACAIFTYLAAIYLGLMRAKLSGHYGTPDERAENNR